MPSWLKDAVFYEIYPQSFYDSNGDGIGDFQGITEKLEYIADLGFNALWLNPCFDSPMRDAGYDVRDFKKTAQRYGSNDDLKKLIDTAHEMGIHVLLDLVAGHTSEEHKWFKKSGEALPNEYWNRYIWSDFCFKGVGETGYSFIGGEHERSGVYVPNFFKFQPALNYGWLHPTEKWQTGLNDPDALATREAIKDVMRFWLDLGCDGFRVDMAGSLVKGDDEKQTGTSAVWKDIRKMLDEEYPEAVLVAEWSRPEVSLPAGFHMDFLLNVPGSPYNKLVRDYQNHAEEDLLAGPGFDGTGRECPALTDYSYFKKDSGADMAEFADYYRKLLYETKEHGYLSLISGNHDTVRASFTLSEGELKLFYAFLFTMPCVPFLYYGDEIGMRYRDLPTKEGGYFRTGSRTPMQWDDSENLGFSKASPEKLYLPTDPAQDAPTVLSQAEGREEGESLLQTVSDLVHFRHEREDLRADASFEIVSAEKDSPVFAYRRGELLCVLNPSEKAVPVPEELKREIEETEECFRVDGGDGRYQELTDTVPPQSFSVRSRK